MGLVTSCSLLSVVAQGYLISEFISDSYSMEVPMEESSYCLSQVRPVSRVTRADVFFPDLCHSGEK